MHTIEELIWLKENADFVDAPYDMIRELASELIWLYEKFHKELGVVVKK